MAACKECGKRVGFFDVNEGLCPECVAQINKLRNEERTKAEQEQQKLVREIETILLTTETAPNLNITKRLKIVVASKESSLDLKLATKQEELFYDLKEKCHVLGGNAVVGVSINIVETYAANIGVGEFKKFALVAYGTAVLIKDVMVMTESSPWT